MKINFEKVYSKLYYLMFFSNVEYKVVEIQDPFGPAIVDPTLGN